MKGWHFILIIGQIGLTYSLSILRNRMNIRLFIKPHCPWCHKARQWLGERGIRYETLDVIADGNAMTEMANLSGQRLAPVIDVDGKILADFGPEELAKFWKQFEAADQRK
jgi:glutaredoxin